ncbi:hypothetical protein F503_08262 [Ophiostoma piceae UAMH 11346]|uniref:Uncharacterized protein n=1 Tax=Ophiostoma piceae (strain UAMH 11346) TaxID=1262450 RepID=S3C1Z7_OPHP1|nr:hypothetical protein F503_08262 [Ophiostoma piceae UAMH 11346]
MATATHYAPETSVLMPTKEASNVEWPGYVLSDAVVYRPDGKTMANALLINQEGPFIIRGRLEIDDDDDEVQHLIDPTVRSIDIEIQDSKVYSIGYYPEAVVWLSGKAGWFEINPHPSYAKIYKDMCEVSQLDYILAKIYIEEDGSLKDTKMDPALADIKEVLLRYALALGDGITYEETVDKILRLGPALVSHMESSTGLAWKQTSIYAWLVRELKNKERMRRSSSRGTSQPPPATSGPASTHTPLTQSPVPVPAISQQTAQTPQPRPLSQTLAFRESPAVGPRAAAARETPFPPPETGAATERLVPEDPRAALQEVRVPGVVSKAEEEEVFQLFFKVVTGIGENVGNQSSMTAGKVHAAMNQLYKLKGYNVSKQLSAFYSKRLLECLDESWDGSPYRKYLANDEGIEYKPESNLFLRKIPDQLVRRGTLRAQSPAPHLSHSQAGLSRSQPSPGPAGKRPGLRPTAPAKKRSFGMALGSEGHDEADSIHDQAAQNLPLHTIGRPKKNAKTAHENVPTATAAPQAQLVQDDADSDGDSSSDDDDSDIESETVVAIHSVPLSLSIRPTGPNGTWNCPHPGCRFLVRNAAGRDSSANAARESIHAHLRGHEENTLSRVDLAISEGSRKHVSVDNLLEKIRALADQRAEHGRQDGTPRPATTAAVGTSSSILRRFLF